jgi:hypothetical protein
MLTEKSASIPAYASGDGAIRVLTRGFTMKH